MEKKRQAFGLRVFFSFLFLFFFFLNHSSFRSNLHLSRRETIFCYHSISLKFKNSWGYFSWFIKFTSFQRNLPADLSLPQQLGLQEWAASWMRSTWVRCLGLRLWSFMLEQFFFFWGWKIAGKGIRVLKWIFPVHFPLPGDKEKVVWLSQLKTKPQLMSSAGKNN